MKAFEIYYCVDLHIKRENNRDYMEYYASSFFFI